MNKKITVAICCLLTIMHGQRAFSQKPILTVAPSCISSSTTNVTVTLSNYPAGTSVDLLGPVTGGGLALTGATLNGVIHQTFTTNASFSFTVPVNPSAVPGNSAYGVKTGTYDTVFFQIAFKPSALSISADATTCLSTTGWATITGSATIGNGCNSTWSATSGTLNGTSGTFTGTINPIRYKTTGTAATINAVYTVTTGCAITSSNVLNITPAPPLPTFSLPSCVGNDPNTTTDIIISNCTGPDQYNLVWEDIFSPTYTNFLNVTTGNAGTNYTAVKVGANWVIQVPGNPDCSNNGYRGVYLIKNNTCPLLNGVTTTLGSSTAPFSLSYNVTTHTIQSSVTSGSYAWANCSTVTPLSGSTYQYNVTNTSPGTNYIFTAKTNIAGCTYREGIAVAGYLSRPDFNDNVEEPSTVNVYPNPTAGNFTITIPKVNEKAYAILYDVTGKAIREIPLLQGTNNITATDLPTGEYSLVILIDGQTFSKKIIIAK